MSRVSLAADTELKRHGRAIAQHVEAQKQVRKDPDQRELRRLDGQSYIATIRISAMNQLRNRLSTPSWEKVRAHVNTVYRQRITVMTPSARRP